MLLLYYNIILYNLKMGNLCVGSIKDSYSLDFSKIEIYNQELLSSCSICSFSTVFQYILQKKLNTTNIKLSNNDIDVLKKFKPSRYYLFYYSCCRNLPINNENKNIDLNNYLAELSNGIGSSLEDIKYTIKTYGILNELIYEQNESWLNNKLSDDPITNQENIKLEELLSTLKIKLSDLETSLNQYVDGSQDYYDQTDKINNVKKNISNLQILISNIGTISDININISNDDKLNALKWKNVVNYEKINIENKTVLEINQIIKTKLKENIPILISIKFNTSINPNSNTITIKELNTNNPIHSMVIIGYDDSRNTFKLINSYGKAWGDNGYCYLSYDTLIVRDYLINLEMIDLDLNKYG
jgi:hypothetical protein